MPPPEFFRVAKGGYTSLAGEIDHAARAGVAALRRQFNALDARVTTNEDDIAGLITTGVLSLGAGFDLVKGSLTLTKIDDIVFCTIVVANNTGSAITNGAVFATAQVGFRPANDTVVPFVASSSAGEYGRIQIAAAGNLSLNQLIAADSDIDDGQNFAFTASWLV